MKAETKKETKVEMKVETAAETKVRQRNKNNLGRSQRKMHIWRRVCRQRRRHR